MKKMFFALLAIACFVGFLKIAAPIFDSYSHHIVVENESGMPLTVSIVGVGDSGTYVSPGGGFAVDTEKIDMMTITIRVVGHGNDGMVIGTAVERVYDLRVTKKDRWVVTRADILSPRR